MADTNQIQELKKLLIQFDEEGRAAEFQETASLIDELETKQVREEYDAKPYWRQAMQSFEDVARTAGSTIGVGDPELARRSRLQLSSSPGITGPANLAPAAETLPLLAIPSAAPEAAGGIVGRTLVGGAEGATIGGGSAALQGGDIQEGMEQGGIFGAGGQLIGEALGGVANLARSGYQKLTGTGPDPNAIRTTQPSPLAVREMEDAKLSRVQATNEADQMATGILDEARVAADTARQSRQDLAAGYRSKAQRQAQELVERTKAQRAMDRQRAQEDAARQAQTVEERATGMLENARVEALMRQNAAQQRIIDAKKAQAESPAIERLRKSATMRIAGKTKTADRVRKEAEAEVKKLQREHDSAVKALKKETDRGVIQEQKAEQRAEQLRKNEAEKARKAGIKTYRVGASEKINAQQKADRLTAKADERAATTERQAEEKVQGILSSGTAKADRVKSAAENKAESQFGESTKNIPTQADKIEMVEGVMRKGGERAEADVAYKEGRTIPNVAQQDIREGTKFQYFTDEEKAAVKKLIKGNLGTRAAKQLGRMGWTDLAGLVPAAAFGSAGFALGGPLGIAAAAAPPITGMLARRIANANTKRAGKEALRVVKGQPKQEDTLPPEIVELLRRYSISQGITDD